MGTDVVISGADNPRNNFGLSYFTSSNKLDVEEPIFNFNENPTITSLGEEQSWMSVFGQYPEVFIPPANANTKLTSAIYDVTNSTFKSEQKPIIRLPQNVVAQKNPINVIDANAVPIQIWEGCVQSVNIEEGTMKASLNAKIGVIPEHIGTIDLQWVPDQDVDLVKPGAVFYLTLFKRVKRGGTIENSQSIQFRRRPNWSKNQLDKINERAGIFLSKIKSKPIAD